MDTSASPNTAVSADVGRDPVDTLIFVYDADSGIIAMLFDAMKKAVGKEDCALCEITHGPLGKKAAWRSCETQLGVAVQELHRDQVPAGWGISQNMVPCILGMARDGDPFVLMSRSAIEGCAGHAGELAGKIRVALDTRDGDRRVHQGLARRCIK